MKHLLPILLLGLLAGCASSELETGYKPRPLTDSPAMRRAYYVNPYSPDANPDSRASPDALQHRPRGF